MNNLNNRLKGSSYEDVAASFLVSKKYRILEQNYRRKTGEIDIIAEDVEKNTLVFCEVKYRYGTGRGYPEEAVTASKQARITRTAMWYLTEKKIGPVRSRFDVISITGDEIRHIENAFGGF